MQIGTSLHLSVLARLPVESVPHSHGDDFTVRFGVTPNRALRRLLRRLLRPRCAAHNLVAVGTRYSTLPPRTKLRSATYPYGIPPNSYTGTPDLTLESTPLITATTSTSIQLLTRRRC